MLPNVLPLEPHFREMIWGGRRLQEEYDKALPPGGLYGESWEVSAYPGMESIVAAGPLYGRSLRSLVESQGHEMLGEAVFDRYRGEFPLLVKLLDAQQDLSIQVHPDDAYARMKRLGRFGKMEAWYVLRSDNGRIACGLKPGVDRSEFVDAIDDNRVSDAVEFLRRPPRRRRLHPARDGPRPLRRGHGVRGPAIQRHYLPHFRLQPPRRRRETQGFTRRRRPGGHRFRRSEPAIPSPRPRCPRQTQATPSWSSPNISGWNAFTHPETESIIHLALRCQRSRLFRAAPRSRAATTPTARGTAIPFWSPPVETFRSSVATVPPLNTWLLPFLEPCAILTKRSPGETTLRGIF